MLPYDYLIILYKFYLVSIVRCLYPTNVLTTGLYTRLLIPVGFHPYCGLLVGSHYGERLIGKVVFGRC